MMGHNHKHMALKMLIFGLVIIYARLYTAWDIWVVIGVLMILKAVVLFVHPGCKEKKKK